MSGYVNPVFRPDFTGDVAPPVNRLAPGFNAIWPASNPVGTETTQSMQSATPTDQIAFMRPDGTPVMQSDLARAHEQVQTAMQVAPTMVLGMMGTTDPAGIRAFHGSPYDFERFDTSKIGTGEGAQAYGHGLYMAGNENVARSYRDALSEGADFNTSTGGRVPNWVGNSVKQIGDQFGSDSGLYGSTIDRHIDEFQRRIEGEQDPAVRDHYSDTRINNMQNIIKSLQELKSGDATLSPRGRMYEVNIGADPEQFLHWDKPLSEQPKAVQDALAAKVERMKKNTDPVQRPMQSWLDQYEKGTLPGSSVYASLGQGSAESSAAAWQQAGIPGIRYLDQGSRNAGGWHITPPDQTVSGKWMVKSNDYNSQGMHFDNEADARAALDQKIGGQTHNYVVFDANTIDILRKYGLAGLGIGLGAAAAGTQQQSQ